MNAVPTIGAVVLAYNSHKDLSECLRCLTGQIGVDLQIVVVDNKSEKSSLMQMVDDFTMITGSTAIGAAEDFLSERESSAYFLKNSRNAGYSGGNNIGAKFAVEKGCEAVLVINPDVRIDDPHYIAELAAELRADVSIGIAASRIVNLNGHEENPMAELSFWGEILWPLKILSNKFLRTPNDYQRLSEKHRVEKVSGACFLISAHALRIIEFFDDEVFLYCEESILGRQMAMNDLHILFMPNLVALHAHDYSERGNQFARYKLWARSREYYDRCYTDRGPLPRTLLRLSRKILLVAIYVRQFAIRPKFLMTISRGLK